MVTKDIRKEVATLKKKADRMDFEDSDADLFKTPVFPSTKCSNSQVHKMSTSESSSSEESDVDMEQLKKDIMRKQSLLKKLENGAKERASPIKGKNNGGVTNGPTVKSGLKRKSSDSSDSDGETGSLSKSAKKKVKLSNTSKSPSMPSSGSNKNLKNSEINKPSSKHLLNSEKKLEKDAGNSMSRSSSKRKPDTSMSPSDSDSSSVSSVLSFLDNSPNKKTSKAKHVEANSDSDSSSKTSVILFKEFSPIKSTAKAKSAEENSDSDSSSKSSVISFKKGSPIKSAAKAKVVDENSDSDSSTGLSDHSFKKGSQKRMTFNTDQVEAGSDSESSSISSVLSSKKGSPNRSTSKAKPVGAKSDSESLLNSSKETMQKKSEAQERFQPPEDFEPVQVETLSNKTLKGKKLFLIRASANLNLEKCHFGSSRIDLNGSTIITDMTSKRKYNVDVSASQGTETLRMIELTKVKKSDGSKKTSLTFGKPIDGQILIKTLPPEMERVQYRHQPHVKHKVSNIRCEPLKPFGYESPEHNPSYDDQLETSSGKKKESKKHRKHKQNRHDHTEKMDVDTADISTVKIEDTNEMDVGISNNSLIDGDPHKAGKKKKKKRNKERADVSNSIDNNLDNNDVKQEPFSDGNVVTKKKRKHGNVDFDLSEVNSSRNSTLDSNDFVKKKKKKKEKNESEVKEEIKMEDNLLNEENMRNVSHSKKSKKKKKKHD